MPISCICGWQSENKPCTQSWKIGAGMRGREGSALGPAWLQLFPMDFLSGGHAGGCAWTSTASLCKHLENLELVFQTVMLFGWYDYLSVLQLAARVYPAVLFGSTLIYKDCIWQLVMTSLWLQNFHFSCHRSHQMLHLSVCFCFRQLCFQIHEFGGDREMVTCVSTSMRKKSVQHFHVCFLLSASCVFFFASIFFCNGYLYLLVIFQ